MAFSLSIVLMAALLGCAALAAAGVAVAWALTHDQPPRNND